MKLLLGSFFHGVTFTEQQKEEEIKINDTYNIDKVRFNWQRVNQALIFLSNELKNFRDKRNLNWSRFISFVAIVISLFALFFK